MGDKVNVTSRLWRNENDERCGRPGETLKPVCHSRGFSMIELLIAVAVMMILAAIGIPQVMNAVYFSRIRSAADNVSMLLQQARLAAEKNNATVPFFTGNVGVNGVTGAFISCSTSGGACPGGNAWSAGDPYVPYAGSVTNSTNPPAAVPNASLGFTPQAGTLYFTPLGRISSTATGAYTSQGFVFYLTDAQNHWAAVSVSPTGRNKVWLYTGSWH